MPQSRKTTVPGARTPRPRPAEKGLSASQSRKTTASCRRASVCRKPGKILDLFAGAGGWEEGLGMLGMSALGIEMEPWACETARAAGHERLQADVAALDPLRFAPVWGLIGSPPCQAYSTAGKGLGRADKPLVIACAHELTAGHDSRAARLKKCRDPRSLLTVEPLRYALALKPKWVALEQVPAVLELWTLFAALLSTHGYHTAVGLLSAERYGVPQTRKRAFLVASLDGPVRLPDPTHRSYNARRQEIPKDELGLEPWVSMAEALGWKRSEEIGFPHHNDTPSNHPSKSDTRTNRKRNRRPARKPAPTLTSRTRSWTHKPSVQTRRSGEQIAEGLDPTDAPAQALTTRVNRWPAHGVETQGPAESSPDATGANWTAERPAPTLVTTRRSKDGALVGRQLPPGEGVERGGWAWRNGPRGNASIRASGEPAPTVHFAHSATRVEWVPCAYETRQRGARPRPISKPAPTMLAAGLAKGTPIWTEERPATTVRTSAEVTAPTYRDRDPSWQPGKRVPSHATHAVRVTVQQAAVLQGFPEDYPWQGARTRQFEQIGNAVPPPLAHRVLEQAIQPSKPASRPRATKEEPRSARSRTPSSSRAHDPDDIVARARAEHEPVAVWCLFSGGNDSTVLAHRCREHYQALAWIDTGTAVPGVAEFVSEYAEWIGKPLRVLHAGDAYRHMVIGDLLWWARFIVAHNRDPGLSVEAFIARDTREHGRASGGELGQIPHGFPGPGSHGRAYNRLKERQIRALLRGSKVSHSRNARVLFLSGIRRVESRRRSKREAINRLGSTSAVFANPLIDWTGEDMCSYRREHQIPESPAAALLHRSGECNCGAFANADGEREMLKALYPDWFAGIEALEAEAQAAGVRWCRWGGYDVHGNRAGEVTREKPGLLCESCETRQHSPAAPCGRPPRRGAASCPVERAGRQP
jgi:DNA (cytosine-5)-methyltransferase 1